MTEPLKYNFSFTAASLRLNEMLLMAQAQANGIPLDTTSTYGHGKKKTGTRIASEINKRLSLLTEQQRGLLLKGDLMVQKEMVFLSICKASTFIRDFAIEVLREKVMLFNYELAEIDFISYYLRKAETNPEVDKLTELTRYKIKQVIYMILDQAGITQGQNPRIIQVPILSQEVQDVIIEDNPNWLKVFLMTDIEIKNRIAV